MDPQEMLQFNALLEARANASGMDMSSISDDTRQRVAAMLKSRRDRMLEEEREYLEELRASETDAKFEAEIAQTMTEDEKTARIVVVKQEEKAFERIVRVFDEQFAHLSAGMLTLRQQKEIEASRAKKLVSLERELNRQRFQLYWEHHRREQAELAKGGAAAQAAAMGLSPGGRNRDVDAASPQAQVHRMTAVLRRAYEKSAPMFATDPEELWRRGQALPPTAAARSTTMGGDIDLPPYHEFGKRVRERYASYVQQHGLGHAVGAPAGAAGGGAASGGGSSVFRKPPSSATFPHQQASPFATSMARQLDDFLGE